MRLSLKHLIENTILLKYHLPNSSTNVNKSKISTDLDSCYTSDNDEDLSKVIYNAVIEYAFNEYDITEKDLDFLHRTALAKKLKFNVGATDEQKLKYGFYGEVILYCILHLFYKAPPVISRGHFYNILENSETKGYDAYHLIDNQTQIELWFGEVKFYSNFKAATTGKNGAITNLNKAISDNYLNQNLIAISEKIEKIASTSTNLISILNEIRNNPEIKISDISKKYDIKLVYPILVLFDPKNNDYDKTIQDAIQHIENDAEIKTFDISLEISLFFILIPVNSTKTIKSKVIEWIKNKEPLIQ
jgi:hypothetical protein